MGEGQNVCFSFYTADCTDYEYKISRMGRFSTEGLTIKNVFFSF